MPIEPTYVVAWLPGGFEWVVIGLVGLLLFGRRLPEIMRGLGGSVREFKKGMEVDEKPVVPAAVAPPEGSVSRAVDNQPPASKA